MMTANVIHRVFRVHFAGNQATAFVLDVDNRQYLVTAKHVIENFSGSGSIEIFANGTWSPRPAQLVGHASARA
jgi:hypothetical protein